MQATTRLLSAPSTARATKMRSALALARGSWCILLCRAMRQPRRRQGVYHGFSFRVRHDAFDWKHNLLSPSTVPAIRPPTTYRVRPLPTLAVLYIDSRQTPKPRTHATREMPRSGAQSQRPPRTMMTRRGGKRLLCFGIQNHPLRPWTWREGVDLTQCAEAGTQLAPWSHCPVPTTAEVTFCIALGRAAWTMGCVFDALESGDNVLDNVTPWDNCTGSVLRLVEELGLRASWSERSNFALSAAERSRKRAERSGNEGNSAHRGGSVRTWTWYRAEGSVFGKCRSEEAHTAPSYEY